MANKLIWLLFALLTRCCFTMFYEINTEVKGFPESIKFEPIMAKPPKSRIQFDLIIYDTDRPVYLVMGQKDTLNEKLYCEKDLLSFSEDNISPLLSTASSDKESGYQLKGTFFINETGLYTYFLMSCAFETNQIKEPAKAHGSISVISSNGYLPAHKWPYIWAYAMLAIVFLGLIILWINICYKHKENLFEYHKCITIVLLVTFFEMLLRFIYFLHTNISGFELTTIYSVSNVCLVIRKLFSRIIILLICKGVGIVTDMVSKQTKQLLLLISSFYFITCVCIEESKNHFLYEGFMYLDLFLFILLTIIDAVFFAWFFVSLYQTLDEIGDDDTFKKEVYVSLLRVFIVGFCMVVLFGFAQIYYVSNKFYLEEFGWRIHWILDFGFYDFVFILFMLTAMRILDPSIEISKYKQIKTDKDSIENKRHFESDALFDGADSDEESSNVEPDLKVGTNNNESKAEENELNNK